MPLIDPTGGTCSIARTITALGDRWSLLVLRESAMGTTRFSDFRSRLGIASDVLTDRLQALVDRGVLERVAYQEEGSRTRTEYRLTEAGREFQVVLGALGMWGREHLRSEIDAGAQWRDASGRPVRVAFVDADGHVLGADDVEVSRR
ncbi:winged helix-turn-helix transcriptional regulator [Amnibacterium kyonggiense]|uniref:HxlR family transcriptional regulator n=1 Tax=Amnibacterium kyonggiense TaxID=595671 RepID=A0A4R7FL83_9MICO|nr:helix-turn-helix domain-containing protein [Amnibacterium kyonggiense]TDS77162.1 HxlR family transcriptional regulator [Amnibacterium kyonggiense]